MLKGIHTLRLHHCSGLYKTWSGLFTLLNGLLGLKVSIGHCARVKEMCVQSSWLHAGIICQRTHTLIATVNHLQSSCNSGHSTIELLRCCCVCVLTRLVTTPLTSKHYP